MNDSTAKPRAELFAKLAKIVGEGPIDRLEEALTHPSFSNESPKPDNQRLEFLGDSVLGLCVSELLVSRHPSADEGLLTRMRSALVNTDALADWARTIDLGPCLALGRGARASFEHEQRNVLADAVEAVVAAVYFARGLEGARSLVAHVVGPRLHDAELLGHRDPKSTLQELVQGEGRPTPVYKLVGVEGPPHAQTFTVNVLVGDGVVGSGTGPSKRLAERAAARDALAKIEGAGASTSESF